MSSGRPVRSNRSAISWALLHEPSEGEEVVPEEHGSAWDDDVFLRGARDTKAKVAVGFVTAAVRL